MGLIFFWSLARLKVHLFEHPRVPPLLLFSRFQTIIDCSLACLWHLNFSLRLGRLDCRPLRLNIIVDLLQRVVLPCLLNRTVQAGKRQFRVMHCLVVMIWICLIHFLELLMRVERFKSQPIHSDVRFILWLLLRRLLGFNIISKLLHVRLRLLLLLLRRGLVLAFQVSG